MLLSRLRPLVFFAASALAWPAAAQVSPTVGSGNAPGGVEGPAPRIVMNLAAHPDDEDGQTLAYYRGARNAVAYSVLFTRGEGGQNEIGPDLYEALGALRTEETERAARYLGTEVVYLNLYDFGYSKHAAEAFAAWSTDTRTNELDAPDGRIADEEQAALGRDRVTAMLVRLIREKKPDVLFTNHDTTTTQPGAQHGQHQVVGIAAYDAMALAADPSYHPEQLAEAGVDLWQPKRLFRRHWRNPASYDVAVPVGDACPDGQPCAERAIAALYEHASQGMGQFASRIRADSTYFSLLRAAPDAPPIPDGATDLAAGLAPNPHAATRPVGHLVDAGRVAPLPDGVLQAAGGYAVPGDAVLIRWDDALAAAVEGGTVTFGYPLVGADGGEAVFPLAAGEATPTLAPGATPTLPASTAQYARLGGRPPITVAVYDRSGGLRYADRLPLEIAPPVALDPIGPDVRLKRGANPVRVGATVYRPKTEVAGLAASLGTDGCARAFETSEDQRRLDISLDCTAAIYRDREVQTGGRVEDVLLLHVPDTTSAGTYRLFASASVEGARDVQEARAHLLPPVRVPDGLTVGFVRSYDDATRDALGLLGANVVDLDSLDLVEGRFQGLHAIWVDIRAYLTRADLRAHNDRLLEWVEGGGHLVVAYQKLFEWNEGRDAPAGMEGENAAFAPYPLTLGRDRVTYEDAPVTPLVPDHSLLTYPYAIGPDDWTGWVQERGLYFPSEADPAYRRLLAMSDPGEEPLDTSLLVAEYGEGTYVYTALGLYRQLQAYRPGAYRLLANLVSLPLAP
jgi:LmbE family N-acetylglucosaminyl deacetylase